jgi:hypothetical protein
MVSGALWHILINILFCYSGLTTILNIDLNLMLVISTVTFYFSYISIYINIGMLFMK